MKTSSGGYKNGMYYCRNRADTTLEKFIWYLKSYIRWYNERRISYY